MTTEPIRAEISGGDRCKAEGHTVKAAAPVLALCRRLIEAGYDPATPLHAYRGDVLCLKVRSIGYGAKWTVDESRTPRLVRWKPSPFGGGSVRIAPGQVAATHMPPRLPTHRSGSPHNRSPSRAEARAALDPVDTDQRDALKIASAGTLGWLASRYFGSAEFRRLDPKSQRVRRSVIEDCLREPRKPGADDLMRDCPMSALAPAHAKMLRDRKSDMPGAANNRGKYLSSMFGWAVEDGSMRTNPAREIRRIGYATDGIHTWSADEVRQFEERHPIGTKARLALALLLFLGVRRGDVVTLGRQTAG